MNSKTIALVGVIAVIVVVIVVLQTSSNDTPNLEQFREEVTQVALLPDTETTGLEIGDHAPDFALADVSGSAYSLGAFRDDKAVVVNFWASWCPPCREEFPAFESQFQNNKEDITIIGVNLQESSEAVEGFVAQIPVSFPLLLDPSAEVKRRYNVFTQPVTYFIDTQGVIVDKKFGPLTESEIEEKFAKLK